MACCLGENIAGRDFEAMGVPLISCTYNSSLLNPEVFGFYLMYNCHSFPWLAFRFQNSDGEVKYLRDAEELIRPERNTLTVSFVDLEQFNQQLSTTVQEEFYR